MADPRAPSPYLYDARALATSAAALRGGFGERRATCELRFLDLPADYGFLLIAGVDEALRALEQGAPGAQELNAIRASGVVDDDFLEHLAGGPLRLDVDAAEDGHVVFAHEPVLTLEGRLCDVLLGASIARRSLVRATAVATRAARRTLAAQGAPILDGSSALAYDIVGAELIARAAFLGGASATTATLVASRLGIPVRATTKDEIADLLHTRVSIPDGWGASDVDRAVDLGSDDDELTILALRHRGAGQGGFIVHDLDAPTELDCRIDIVALESDGGTWAARLGATFDPAVDPGRKLVVRYLDVANGPVADIVHLANERIQPASGANVVGASGVHASMPIHAARSVPLTRTVMRGGRRVGAPDALESVRDRAMAALSALDARYLQLKHPARYPVGMSPALAQQKAELIAERAVP